MSMVPNKPYVTRAFYEWIVASECTPYLVVDTTIDYVDVPEEYIDNDQIVLNLSPVAIKDLQLHNRYISFSAQFSGELKHIYVPIAAVSAIYAKENGRGMMFDSIDEDEGHPMLEPVPKSAAVMHDGDGDGGDDGSGSGKGDKSGGGSAHLKIIK